jgi:flagellar motor switch protein FliN/FliY
MRDKRTIIGAIEAILFIAGEPVAVEDLAHALNLTATELVEYLAEMKDELVNIDSLHEDILCIKFKMEIEDLINSEIIQVFPMEAVQNIMDLARGSADQGGGAEAAPVPEPKAAPVPPPAPAASPSPGGSAAKSTGQAPSYNVGFDNRASHARDYDVQQVQFSPLEENMIIGMPQNIELIMDVPLDVTVELGKTKKTIKDVLELQQGSIIQLERMAGESVDMLVNGKLIAKGEVVVIDEYYGIRITNILSPLDRVQRLQ